MTPTYIHDDKISKVAKRRINTFKSDLSPLMDNFVNQQRDSCTVIEEKKSWVKSCQISSIPPMSFTWAWLSAALKSKPNGHNGVSH